MRGTGVMAGSVPERRGSHGDQPLLLLRGPLARPGPVILSQGLAWTRLPDTGTLLSRAWEPVTTSARPRVS